MGNVDRATIKTYFNTGDKPTEAQFVDLVDSEVGYFSTMQDLVDTDVSGNADGQVFLLDNFYSDVEGGGDYFSWDASQAKSNHNGITIIDPNHSSTPGASGWWSDENTGSGCYLRADKGFLNVKDAGAKGDDTNDDYGALNAAFNATQDRGHLVIPDGEYKFSDTLQFDSDKSTLTCIGVLKWTGAATNKVALKIGGTAQARYDALTVNGLKIENSNSGDTWGDNITGVELENVIWSKIEILRCHYFTIGLDMHGNGDGTATNDIYIGRFNDCKQHIKFTRENGGFINGNTFRSGILARTESRFTDNTDTYAINIPDNAGGAQNSNIFLGIKMDAGANAITPEYGVYVGDGNRNHFYNLYSEFVNGTVNNEVVLSANSALNKIQQSFGLSESDITDNGSNNVIELLSGGFYNSKMRIDFQDRKIGIGSGTLHDKAGLQMHDPDRVFITNQLFQSQVDDISSPINGMLVYNESNDRYEAYSEDRWKPFAGGDYGIETASGDGVATTFTITHNLGAAPNFANAVPRSDDASEIKKITHSGSDITIHYDTAPPSGTNNLEWYWKVEL